MARRFATSINLSQNELQNARIQNLPTPPPDPKVGQFYFDTNLNFERSWDGTAWQRSTYTDNVYDRAFAIGTQLASTISDLQTVINATALNSFAVPTASVPFNAQRITALGDPLNPQDAATKNYVDTVVQGKDYKDSVQVATVSALATNSRSGNILTATSNGPLGAVDGVTVLAGNRILVKNEATASKNGIYTITSLGSGSTPWILTRANDADADGKVTQGATVVVDSGSINGNTQYTLTTPDPITINTTALTFSKTVGAGGITYSAGNGLSLSGTTFSANVGLGLISDSSNLRIDTSIVSRMVQSTITGDGSKTSFDVTHGLGNQFPFGQIYNMVTGAREEANVVGTSSNVVTVSFDVAPTAGLSYRVTVIG